MQLKGSSQRKKAMINNNSILYDKRLIVTKNFKDKFSKGDVLRYVSKILVEKIETCTQASYQLKGVYVPVTTNVKYKYQFYFWNFKKNVVIRLSGEEVDLLIDNEMICIEPVIKSDEQKKIKRAV